MSSQQISPVSKARKERRKARRQATARAIGHLEQTRYSRLGLPVLLQEGKLSIQLCDIDLLFTNIQFVRPRSASDTALFLATINPQILQAAGLDPTPVYNTNVAVKMSLEDSTGKDDSLVVEGLIYSGVINQLVQKHITPNLVLYIGTIICNNPAWVAANNNPEIHEIEKRIKTLARRTDKKPDRIQLLVVEETDGVFLEDWMEKSSHTFDEWATIFFQIIYTVHAYTSNGIQHNDLHASNIFIDTLAKDRNFAYFINNKEFYEFDMKYMAKIFDWDFGLMTARINLKIFHQGFCDSWGICNEIDPKFDLFTIFYYIQRDMASIAIQNPARAAEKDMVNNILSRFVRLHLFQREELKNNRGNGRICARDRYNTACNGKYRLSDPEMLPPLEMLKTNVFDSMRQSYPEELPLRATELYALKNQESILQEIKDYVSGKKTREIKMRDVSR